MRYDILQPPPRTLHVTRMRSSLHANVGASGPHQAVSLRAHLIGLELGPESVRYPAPHIPITPDPCVSAVLEVLYRHEV